MQTIRIEHLPGCEQPVEVDFEGVRVPVHYRKGSSPNLVVIFHGAVDRSKRKLPFFQPHFSIAAGAHQLSVADPALARAPDLKATWYAGSQDLPLQHLLPRLFARVVAVLGVERTVYFGASSGGFAALFYSHAHPGSLALVANPQINLANYLAGPIGTFRRHCWPAAADVADLASLTCIDVAELYARSVPNFVCLLNSAGDRSHIFTQTLHFAQRLREEARSRVVLHNDYYGIPGHSGSVPMLVCTPWLEAAMHAPNWYADSLLGKFHQLRSPTPMAMPAKPAEPAAGDVRTAEALASWELSNPTAKGE